MGNKIITEKDFWMCTGGLMPAPIQTTQLSTKKVGDYKYITVNDTATVSFIDFSCKKLMFVMAMLAVAIALVTVATGGMALVAICAAAAAGGAIFGAIIGSLLCGQLAAAARYWMQSKSNLIIQGQQAITGDHKMQCMIFGDIISFAPQIKNWWQAIALGASNFIGEVLKNAMYGAAIGCGAAVISGGPAVLSQFGLSNIGANWLATWGGYGLGLRGLMGAQSMLGAYGNTGTLTAGDVATGVFSMEVGTYHAAKNILSGNGSIDDVLGLAMWMLPAPKNNRAVNEEARPNEQNRGEETRTEETRTEEESTQARNNEGETQNQQGERNAFEDSPDLGNSRVGALGEQSVVDALAAQGYTEVLQVQNNSGHGVDVIARNPTTGDVKVIEVKANQSTLNPDQRLGGESYAADRLRRAANGERGYGVPPNPPNLPIEARRAQQWIQDAPNVDYEVHRVQVNRTTGEVTGTTITPWDPPPPPAPNPPVAPDE